MAIQKPTLLETDIWARLAAEADKTKPTQTEINEGFAFGQKPTHQSHNWLFNVFSAFIAHLNQMGIAQWDATTEYITGSLAMDGSVLYQALKDSVNKKPSENLDDYWAEFKPTEEEKGGVKWDSNKCPYHGGDIVTDNNSVYFCNYTETCNKPADGNGDGLNGWIRLSEDVHNHDTRYPRGQWSISGTELHITVN